MADRHDRCVVVGQDDFLICEKMKQSRWSENERDLFY